MRSTFGKATRDVSGSGRKKHTPREEWITRKLAFLSSHVYRVPIRSRVNFLQQLKQRHPDRFDAVATEGQGQTQETGKETEETGDVCDEEEEPVGTGTPVCSKRRKTATATATATSTVMERIEERIAAKTQAQQQLMEKEETAHIAFGRMISLAAGKLDEESWDTFQLEVNQCLVKARRETRERGKAAESRRHLQPQGDIAAQQQQQCAQGILQDWQHHLQLPPAQQQPVQPPARSASAPPQGSTPYSFGEMLALE
ncbi:uncharacterized protein LOC121380217 [Gigantopelta aegis]|uniref:uncharacterized protein LOC121380217 n=1 Tax=Gigantopelta aegis TaxID=1735272 RepID=UPI001B88CF88|nr:uncharacterized protein LOC121380217 [Gigantopelta aegis]XP_041364972.1 uncharacterized protein LOC121380217 [Gigantopelta aegis]